MKTTLKDIATSLKLSPTLVSQVLNQKADLRVAEATRRRILDAAREMNYRPSASAQALATGRTMQIAVLASDQTRPDRGHYTDIRGLIDIAGEHDFRVVVLPLHEGDRGTKQLENLIQDHVCDGLCLFSDQLGDGQLEVLRKNPVPCVIIGDEPASRDGGELTGAVRIDFDNYRYGYDATSWLIRQGHQRVAYIKNLGEGMQPHSVALRRGYTDALKASFPQAPDLIRPYHEDPQLMLELLKADSITALVIGSTCDALRWARALRKSGYRLPSDVTILALTEEAELRSHFMEDWKYELAFATHNWRDLTRHAARVLIDWIQGSPPEHRSLFLPAGQPNWAHAELPTSV